MQKLIKARLGKYIYTLEEWLYVHHKVGYDDLKRADVRECRIRWLDSLIKEFS